MLRCGTLIALGSMLLLPTAAFATVYNFQDTETSALSPSPVSFGFSLDTATATVGGNGTFFNDVTIDENGALIAGNTVGVPFPTNLGSPLFFWVDTSAVPFSSGSGTGIAFNAGTFAIADGATDGEGTLTISDASVSAVPEPPTWTLLLAGVAVAAAWTATAGKEDPA